ncbi:uncharacterized protein LOC130692668 isoform X2 [Daphnia carinata]|nr:uncharacterized protein LOC130685815 isoform X2 [Daphnia carinata]XP_057371781.1 uncharacterized protein LOC130692668 isoform X2 [Daphnia carinata]
MDCVVEDNVLHTNHDIIQQSHVATNIQDGRPFPEWCGRYVTIQETNEKSKPSKYKEPSWFIVQTLERGCDNNLLCLYSFVTRYWLSTDHKFLLYPPCTTSEGNLNPACWGEKTFERFHHPFNTWLEYDVHNIMNPENKPVNFTRAYLLLREENVKTAVRLQLLRQSEQVPSSTLFKVATVANQGPNF